jgi:predicted dehydrogenase
MEQKQIRIGVIGCGIAQWHLDGFALEPRAKVIAIAGLDTDRCVQLAHKFDIPNIYSDYKELLANPDIDAVSVAVPNILHHPIAMAAIKAGKHVLMEKPLARNATEGAEMVAAAKEAGVNLSIIFNRRSRTDMRILEKHIADGGLGEIYHAKALWLRRSRIPGLGGWFTKKEQAGGGPLIDLGVHVLDMALYLMGNPKVIAVSAAAYAEIGPQGKGQWTGNRFKMTEGQHFEVEDMATAFLRLEGGKTLTLDVSWALYTSATDDFGVTLYGDKGGAELYVAEYASSGTLKLISNIGGADSFISPIFESEPASAGHAAVIHDWVDQLLGGDSVAPTGEEGLDRTRIIDAIYASAEQGREIRLESGTGD